jgi:hypothetical protein
MDSFINIPSVKDVLAEGATKSSVRTKDDVQVDCRVVPDKSFGAALLYFTGSKDHNVNLRGLAIRKGYKLNEYGLFDKNLMNESKIQNANVVQDSNEVKSSQLSFAIPQLKSQIVFWFMAIGGIILDLVVEKSCLLLVEPSAEF